MDVCPNKVIYLNQEERNFFIKCLKNLLTLVDIKKNVDNIIQNIKSELFKDQNNNQVDDEKDKIAETKKVV